MASIGLHGISLACERRQNTYQIVLGLRDFPSLRQHVKGVGSISMSRILEHWLRLGVKASKESVGTIIVVARPWHQPDYRHSFERSLSSLLRYHIEC